MKTDFKQLVTFDTNFIISNRAGIGNIISQIGAKYDVAIVKLVVEEVKGQKARNTMDEYTTLIDKIKVSREKNKWLKITDSTKIDEIIKRQEKELDDWLTKSFKNHIICIDNKELIDIVLERCKYKRPPFNSKENASDKGFKDTMIFLNILEYGRANDYTTIYFVSNDDGFKKNKENLEEEYLNITGKQLIILSGNKEDIYNELQISTQAEESISEEESNIFPETRELQEKEKEDIKEILDEIVLEIKEQGSFFISEKISSADVEKVFNDLPDMFSKYKFLRSVPITEFITGVFKDVNVSLAYLEKLYYFYGKMNNEEKQSLFFAITTLINNCYEELPF